MVQPQQQLAMKYSKEDKYSGKKRTQDIHLSAEPTQIAFC